MHMFDCICKQFERVTKKYFFSIEGTTATVQFLFLQEDTFKKL